MRSIWTFSWNYLILFILASVGKAIKDEHFQKYTYISEFKDSELFQSSFTKSHLEKLKAETSHLFNYAFDKYMEFGFPYDEVLPLTCKPNTRDYKDPSNTVKNDSMGNFTVTLIDSIDTFIIMNDKEKFHHTVNLIKELYSDFAIDSTIQVFETNIRILGSLLTSHLYAIDKRRGFEIPSYDGFLLKLAYDLGKRLVLTFSHIEADAQFAKNNPESDMNFFTFNYPRTNLLKGPEYPLPYKLKYEQCAAGITSLTVEFSLLSRLTNDTIFEDVSKAAVIDYWNKRTDLDLVAMGFDASERTFTAGITGIGASIDSFYEYALKYSVLFNDDIFYDIWKESYTALLTHSQNEVGIFTNINVNEGMGVTEWIDSLGAFFPGLQVLGGDLKNSILLHRTFFKLWNNYGSIPERWNLLPLRSEGFFKNLKRPYKTGDLIDGFTEQETNEILVKNSVGLEWYPLRPELIESTYHLYTATKDPLYLRLGEDFLKRFRENFLAPCGFAGIQNILLDTRQNRQESFALSETLKYLYLLFDVDNTEIQRDNTIFTTEAHPVWFDRHLWDFDPVESKDIESLNLWVEDVPTMGFMDRFLHKKQFNLNKEFAKFKDHFYNVKTEQKYIVRMSNLEAYTKLGIKSYSDNHPHGAIFQVNKAGYDYFKTREKRKVETINAVINHTGEKGYKFKDDYLNLDKCDVPVIGGGSGLLYSTLISGLNDFYRLDRDYALSLRKPLYLLDKEGLELETEFYDRFISFGSQSQREQTTYEWEALITHSNTYNIAPIFTVEDKSKQAKAIYLLELEGLRLRFEDLNIGDIDHNGKVITSKYLHSLVPLEMQQQNATFSSIIRLRKINGLTLDDSEETVFVSSSSSLLSERGTIKETGGFLLLDDKLIYNMVIH